LFGARVEHNFFCYISNLEHRLSSISLLLHLPHRTVAVEVEVAVAVAVAVAVVVTVAVAVATVTLIIFVLVPIIVAL